MKIKLKEVVNSVKALNNLLETSLPVRTAYKLNKVAVKIEPEIKIYNDQKNKMITEWGEEVDGQQTLKTNSEHWSKFIEEMEKLDEIDVEVNFGEGKELEKIKIEDLGDISVEPQDLFALNWLIE